MRLSILAALALTAVGVSATPSAAAPRLAKPGNTTLVTHIADLDGRRARLYRYRRAYGYWPIITSGHRLHRFRGEIVYTYLPGECCWGRGER